MAAEATTAHDPEAQAWHHAQLGDLYVQMGRFAEAAEQYGYAQYVFPRHPFALAGLARLKVINGEYRAALAMYREQLEQSATPELEARIGDLYWLTGDRAEADRHWVLAEADWTSDTPEPTLLARFMAERNRKIPQAIAMAEQAAGTQRDTSQWTPSHGRISVRVDWPRQRAPVRKRCAPARVTATSFITRPPSTTPSATPPPHTSTFSVRWTAVRTSIPSSLAQRRI